MVEYNVATVLQINIPTFYFYRFISLAAWNLKIISTLSKGKTTFGIVNAIVFGIGSLNYLWIIYDLNVRNGLSETKQLVSWIALLVSFVLPTISPNSFRDRLMAIMSSLALPFTLMSLSYEPLFLMTFTSNIYYWVSMIYTDKKQLYAVGWLLYFRFIYFSYKTKSLPKHSNNWTKRITSGRFKMSISREPS